MVETKGTKGAEGRAERPFKGTLTGGIFLLGLALSLSLALPAASAGPQDYVITRGPIGTNYAYNLRLCVVDKNEFMSPVILSSKLVVRRYKNGATSPWGTNTSFPAPPSFAYPDIARDPATGTVYVSFVTADFQQIYTYKRAPADADWVLVAALDKPSANNIGPTTRLSFNASTGTLFLAFDEYSLSPDTTKVYLYEPETSS